MLSDDDKRRIREEEIFRQEVRQALEKEQSKGSFGNRLFKILNIGVGIWFLTSVVVGLVTFAYAKTEEQLKERRETISSIQKLDTEISARLHDLLTLTDTQLDDIKRETPNDRPLSAAVMAHSVDRYIRTTGPPTGGHVQLVIYPEYREVPLLGLIQSLQGQVGDEEQAQTKEARAALQKIADEAVRAPDRWYPGSWDKIEPAVLRFVEDLRRTLTSALFARWTS